MKKTVEQRVTRLETILDTLVKGLMVEVYNPPAHTEGLKQHELQELSRLMDDLHNDLWEDDNDAR